MTEQNAAPRRTWFPRPPIVAAATFAALILAGCSSTHVGESWQCPLAQGGSCTSVEAADPAVPVRAGKATGRVSGEPLYRVRAEPESVPPRQAARTERPCDAACGPFAWLARLFGADTDGDGGKPGAGSGAGSGAGDAAVRPGADAALPLPANTARTPDGPAPGGSAAGDPAPVETGLVEAAGDDPAGHDGQADDLREPEYVGRIWIAPFVDGDGIYREGAWVRLVIAPARWRLP